MAKYLVINMQLDSTNLCVYSHLLETTEVLGTQNQNFWHIYLMILEFRIYEKSFDQLPLKILYLE